jgi:serine/threonine protein kinase
MEDYYGIKSRRAREYIRSLPFKKKIPWKAMFPKTNDLALDLLERLLAFNPVKRITVEDALKHPYLEPYHDPDDEPTADPIPEEFFDFDKNKDNLTKEQLKRKSTSRVCIGSLLTFQSPHLPGDYAINFHVSPQVRDIHKIPRLSRFPELVHS